MLRSTSPVLPPAVVDQGWHPQSPGVVRCRQGLGQQQPPDPLLCALPSTSPGSVTERLPFCCSKTCCIPHPLKCLRCAAALLIVQFALCGFVEGKRWMDFVNPGSQGDGSFFGITEGLKGQSNGYPGTP